MTSDWLQDWKEYCKGKSRTDLWLIWLAEHKSRIKEWDVICQLDKKDLPTGINTKIVITLKKPTSLVRKKHLEAYLKDNQEAANKVEPQAQHTSAIRRRGGDDKGKCLSGNKKQFADEPPRKSLTGTAKDIKDFGKFKGKE